MKNSVSMLLIILYLLLSACTSAEKEIRSIDKAHSTVYGEENSPIASGISGRTYIIEPNNLDIKSISFNFDTSPDKITINNEEKEQSFSVGYEALEFGSMISPRLLSKEVAVSGAWESPDKYHVKIIYFETPHELAFTFQFKEDKLIWDTDQNVSFGPTSLEQLKGNAL